MSVRYRLVQDITEGVMPARCRPRRPCREQATVAATGVSGVTLAKTVDSKRSRLDPSTEVSLNSLSEDGRQMIPLFYGSWDKDDFQKGLSFDRNIKK